MLGVYKWVGIVYQSVFSTYGLICFLVNVYYRVYLSTNINIYRNMYSGIYHI